MDVYTPAGEGPWPVVIAFPGIDSDGKDGEDIVLVAEAAAAEGMVVFAPSWIIWKPPIPPVPVSLEQFQEWKGTFRCAVAFAQQNAGDYGGDSANTTIYGFSAGAGFGLWVSVHPGEDPIPGCETDALPALPSGVVLGDGEYWLHSQNFDGAFEANPAATQAEVAALVDPNTWAAGLDAKFSIDSISSKTGRSPSSTLANSSNFDSPRPVSM